MVSSRAAMYIVSSMYGTKESAEGHVEVEIQAGARDAVYPEEWLKEP